MKVFEGVEVELKECEVLVMLFVVALVMGRWFPLWEIGSGGGCGDCGDCGRGRCPVGVLNR